MKPIEAAGPGPGLRSLRVLARLTLDEVADEAAVSASYLSKVETGAKSPSPAWIGRVSAIISRHLVATSEATSSQHARSA